MINDHIGNSKARLIEVFSAIQGEGLNIGTRQIFIRFAICDLRCLYCDSVHTWKTPPTCRIEKTPGNRDFVIYDNPVSSKMLLTWVQDQNSPNLHDSISLTGGEPLLHAQFLAGFLPVVKQQIQLPIYLETGGHRPQELSLILPYLDSVGMDFKLPSVSGESLWEKHEQFLQLCKSANTEVFVKIIISDHTSLDDLQKAADLISNIDPNIPVFLQPVTALVDVENSPQPPLPEQVLQWQGLMKRSLSSVRVIPQSHKMIAQL
jgi:7-carboxy-7-deazaguanine synthase